MLAISPGVKVIRRSRKDDRHTFVYFRAIHIGRKPHTVTHEHHDFLLDGGNGFKLLEDVVLRLEDVVLRKDR
jgi:hypothetical protein